MIFLLAGKAPRNSLFRVMLRLGCGYLMLSAGMCLYEDTKMVLGAAMITTKLGKRSPLYRGFKIWNGLSKTIQDAPSKFIFKKLLSEMFWDRTP